MATHKTLVKTILAILALQKEDISLAVKRGNNVCSKSDDHRTVA
jgi:hypothetical protein